MRKSLFLLVLGIVFSLAIRIYLIINGSQIADIAALHEMGEMILKGMNPYLALKFNSYPPLGIYLETAIIQLSETFHIQFHMLTKIAPNLADIFTVLIIYIFLLRKKVKPIMASLWSLVFILNPISIIISSSHGQLDSIPTFLVIASIYLLTFYSSKFYIIFSALLFGLAIAIKPNPVMLLPIFLFIKKTNFKILLMFLCIVMIPSVALFYPFIKNDSAYILGKIFGYSGSSDFGMAAIIRGFNYQKNISSSLYFSEESLQISKFIFLFGLALLIGIFSYCGKLIRACLAVYLLFFTFYLGLSAQYLGWIIPFAVLEKDKMIIPYSIAGLISLIGFYLFFNPTILIAGFSSIQPYQAQNMQIYFLGNLLLWITTLVWVIKIIKSGLYILEESPK